MKARASTSKLTYSRGRREAPVTNARVLTRENRMNSAGTHPPICKRREIPACRWGIRHGTRVTVEGGEARRGLVAQSAPMTLLFHPWVGCFGRRLDKIENWSTLCAGVHVLTSVFKAPSRLHMLYGFRGNEDSGGAQRQPCFFHVLNHDGLPLRIDYSESDSSQRSGKLMHSAPRKNAPTNPENRARCPLPIPRGS